MPAVSCPQCGGGARAALSHPDWLTCPACGYRGAPPPALREALVAAGRALFSVDARKRQLGYLQRRLGAGSAHVRRNVHLVFAIPLGLFALVGLALFAIVRKGTVEDVTVALFFLSPAAFFGLLGSWAVRGVVRELERSGRDAEAEPPLVAGGPRGCHVCGADLPPKAGGATITRCRYCQADNVVRDDQAAVATIAATQDLARQVRAHARSLGEHGRSANLRVLGIALLAPFSGFTGLMFAIILSPVTAPTAPLILVRTKHGLCVAEPEGSAGHYRFANGSPARDRPSFEFSPRPEQTFLAPRMAELEFAGSGGKGKPSDFTRRTLLNHEYAVVGGGKHRVSELCLVGDDPGELPVVDVPGISPTADAPASPSSPPAAPPPP